MLTAQIQAELARGLLNRQYGIGGLQTAAGLPRSNVGGLGLYASAANRGAIPDLDVSELLDSAGRPYSQSPLSASGGQPVQPYPTDFNISAKPADAAQREAMDLVQRIQGGDRAAMEWLGVDNEYDEPFTTQVKGLARNALRSIYSPQPGNTAASVDVATGQPLGTGRVGAAGTPHGVGGAIKNGEMTPLPGPPNLLDYLGQGLEVLGRGGRALSDRGPIAIPNELKHPNQLTADEEMNSGRLRNRVIPLPPPINVADVPGTARGAQEVADYTTAALANVPDRVRGEIDAVVSGEKPPPKPPTPDSKLTQDEIDFWGPLATAGFAMAASKSPFFGQAMGEGGLAGLAALNAEKKRAADTAFKKAELALKTREVGAIEKQADAAVAKAGKMTDKSQQVLELLRLNQLNGTPITLAQAVKAVGYETDSDAVEIAKGAMKLNAAWGGPGYIGKDQVQNIRQGLRNLEEGEAGPSNLPAAKADAKGGVKNKAGPYTSLINGRLTIQKSN